MKQEWDPITLKCSYSIVETVIIRFHLSWFNYAQHYNCALMIDRARTDISCHLMFNVIIEILLPID